MTLPPETSDRLRHWAEVIATLHQHATDAATTFNLLAEGARRVLQAELAALLTNAGPNVLEIAALAGVSAADVPLIETVLSGSPLGGQFKLDPQGGLLAQAYFEQQEVFVEQLPTHGSSFAASGALQAALQQTLNLRSWWLLPLTASPSAGCLGVLVLGRSGGGPPTEADHSFAKAFMAQAVAAIQNAQQRMLTEVGQQMTETASATLDLSDVTARVLAFATQLIACDSAALFLRLGDVLRVYAVYQLPRELIGSEFDLASPLREQMIASRAPLYLADVQQEPRFVNTFVSETIRGWLAAPLVIGERFIGEMAFYSKQAGRFGVDEARLVQALARQAALALENAQLYYEATRHLQQMAILNEISVAVMSAPDFPEAMRQVMWAFKRTLRYELVDLWMMTEAGDRLQLVTPEFGLSPTTLRLGEGVSGQVAARGAAVRIDDRRTLTQQVRFHEHSEARSEVCVPIRVGERVIGVIDVQSSRLAAFSEDDVYVLSIVAGQLARALENARLHEAQRQRTEETLALLDVAETISSSLELADILNAAAKRTVVACRVPLCAVLLADEADDTHFRLGSQAVQGAQRLEWDWTALEKILLTHSLQQFPAVWQAFNTGQTQIAEPDDPLSLFLAAPAQQNKFLFVPLRISVRSVGVMILGSHETAQEFDARQVSLAAAIGRQLAVAVENAHLYARTQQNVRDLSASLEQLKQTQAQLVQSGKLAAVGQLAAGVAHEINNPLTTISGFSEIVLRELPGESPLKKDMELVLRETQRARDVVRRLLDFARKSEPHRDPVDLNELARETVVLMRNAAAMRGVRVNEVYAPDLPWISMDVNQFKQVVLNLLNNAVQAMPKGGVLTLATGLQERDGKRGVWIQVADTGSGIPAQNLERIFEPFFTTKPPNEGTGLGLAVSYRIVQEHDGVIEVSSQVNRGTTFVVWLPTIL